MKRNKATHGQLKRHNRQLILRAIYEEVGISRAALAQETGLSKPTVSDFVGELIEEGLIAEGGRGRSTLSGGKRPRLLKFLPTARQIIGVSINTQEIVGGLANMDSQIVAQHSTELRLWDGHYLEVWLIGVINALVAQSDAPLLCLSIGVPGIVDSERGIVQSSPMLGWQNMPLAQYLSEHFDIPVYISNNTELAARVCATRYNDNGSRNLVTILTNNTVELGFAFGNQIFHHGGNIGALRLTDEQGQFVSFLQWNQIRDRLQAFKSRYSERAFPNDGVTYLYVGYEARQQDPVVQELFDEISTVLAQVCAWIIGVIRPDEIALAWPISNMGPALLEAIPQQIKQYLPEASVEGIRFTLVTDKNLSVHGAIDLGLHQELGIL